MVLIFVKTCLARTYWYGSIERFNNNYDSGLPHHYALLYMYIYYYDVITVYITTID